jgi:hypothetical protein
MTVQELQQLDEEAHQLGLSSWDRVDKWLKELGKMKFTKKTSIAFYDARGWEPMSYRQRAEFQMAVGKTCMPIEIFHEALEQTLGRIIVWHELAVNWDGLKTELFGETGTPGLVEIMATIPEETRNLLVSESEKNGEDEKQGEK